MPTYHSRCNRATMIDEVIPKPMMPSTKCATAAWLLVLLLLTSAGTAQKRPRVTGFFSDMHYIKEAGDVIGMEVWIVYARGGYWATVQLAQGEPAPPVIVPVQVSGQRVVFSFQLGTDVLKFDGSVSTAALTGVLGTERMSLKRGNSYWQ